MPKDRLDEAISDTKTQKDRLLAFSETENIIEGHDYILRHNIQLTKLIAFPEESGHSDFMALSDYFTIHKTFGYYDLSLKVNGKDKAIQWVCDRFSLDISNTVAIGDSENDIPMLTVAGIGASVANAAEATKKVCDYISPYTNNENAVADIIYRYL